MLTKEKFTPKYVIPAVLALLYMPLTFILEKRIFHTYMIYDRLFTYISIKILTFAVLYAFVYL
ncbi:MAG: hypothetical protein Q4E94_05280, partial [Clostridia bacterium]|nr:hypothetical protein [Clostridia bacterium]